MCWVPLMYSHSRFIQGFWSVDFVKPISDKFWEGPTYIPPIWHTQHMLHQVLPPQQKKNSNPTSTPLGKISHYFFKRACCTTGVPSTPFALYTLVYYPPVVGHVKIWIGYISCDVRCWRYVSQLLDHLQLWRRDVINDYSPVIFCPLDNIQWRQAYWKCGKRVTRILAKKHMSHLLTFQHRILLH